MNASKGTVGLCLALIGVLAGCTAQIQGLSNPLEIDHEEYARMFDAAVLVLREPGYVVEHQDYRFGTITTKPSGSSTILEPWRSDNTTSDQALTSTFNYQRRLVTVTLEPDSSDNKEPGSSVGPFADSTATTIYLLRIQVLIERLIVPTTHMTGSTSPGRMVANLAEVPTQWRRQGMKMQYWRPIGRDVHLEQRLIDAIVRQSLQLPGEMDE